MASKAFNDLGWRIAYLVAAGAVLLLDQTSKAWAARTLRYPHGSGKSVIDGLLAFEYAENPGVAFGQLQDGGGLGPGLLIGLAVLALIAVLYFFFRTPRTHDRVLGACALLLAGIGGNLIDRIRLGYVIDFILFYFRNWHWPVFNVADAAICIGAAMLALDFIFAGKEKPADEIKATESPAS